MPVLSAEDDEVMAEFWGSLAIGIVSALLSSKAQVSAIPVPSQQVQEILAAQAEAGEFDAPALSAEEEEIMAEFYGTLIFGCLATWLF